MRTLLLILMLAPCAWAERGDWSKPEVVASWWQAPSGASWHPTNISTLISDWDADNYSTNAGVATLLDTWSGYHLTNAAGGTSLLRTNAMINGRSALYLDGVDDYLKNDAYTNRSVLQHEVWVVGVLSPSGTAANRTFDGGTGGAFRHLAIADPGPSSGAAWTNNMSAGVLITSGGALRTNRWAAFTYAFAGASSRMLTNSVVERAGNTGSNTMSGFTLGARFNLVEFGRFYVTRILTFSATNDAANTANIWSYLTNRYGTF